MMKFTSTKNFRRSFALTILIISAAANAFAQNVYTRPNTVPAQPSPTPFVKQTAKQTPALVTQPSVMRGNGSGSTVPNAAPGIAAPDIVQPSFEPTVGGLRGILVETLNGQTVMDNMSATPFNPASNVKLITAYAVIKKLKPSYRFKTQLYTDGTFNAQTGTIEGNLIVVGSDPSLGYEHAMSIAAALNKMGVRIVMGDLIVSNGFTMSYSPSALRSGVLFYDTLDATRRSSAANKAWQVYLGATQQNKQPQSIPSVAVMGAVVADALPANLKPLAAHESAPLKDILKACLSYSNNFLAEKLGDAVGGAYEVERIARDEAKIAPEELSLASSSGLGANRVTPRAMMKVFRALQAELAKHKISPTDIMPVAGVDEGTLHNRFTDSRGRASVIGKTGTLPNTDGGVSTLVGQMATARGEILYFVIFNMRGNAPAFRNYQNQLVTYLQNQRGGAAPFQYQAKSFPALLAGNRVTPEKSFGTNRNEE